MTETSQSNGKLLENVAWRPDSRWSGAFEQFVNAVPDNLRERVRLELVSHDGSGQGLRTWINSIVAGRSIIPSKIDSSIIAVYLDDPESLPLHDCENCGIAIPVRPSRLHDLDSDPEQVYFENCPQCGGRTGWFCFLSKEAHLPHSQQVRRTKPR